MKSIKTLLLTAALASAGLALAQVANPYAGEQGRRIKSLSENDIHGLLAGQGDGYAKAAELNGYPGPAHTLELSRELNLNAEQAAATKALMNAHKARARDMGAQLVDAERRLDALFADRVATAQSVQQAAADVGALQSRLRAEHLNTHLVQTALLDAAQIRRYAELRGYSSPQNALPQNAAPSEQPQRKHSPHH